MWVQCTVEHASVNVRLSEQLHCTFLTSGRHLSPAPSSQVVPAALGVSAVRGFDVNSLAVPRKAKEAIGGIARLRHESDGERQQGGLP